MEGAVVRKIYSSHAAPILEKLQFQGQRNDCGPFTTATVINALTGGLVKAAELADIMNKPAWRGPMYVVRRVPNWATFPWGMADVFRQYGLKASWRLFARTGFLLERLDQGDIVMPVIGEWKPIWAHVMTLLAHDPDRGWGFANTQYDNHDMFWLNDQTFNRQWKNMGHLLVRVIPAESQPKTPE